MYNIQNIKQAEEKIGKNSTLSFIFFMPLLFSAGIWLCLLFAVFAILMCVAFVAELPGCNPFLDSCIPGKINDSIYILERFNFLVSSIVTPVEILSLCLTTLSQVEFKLSQILVLVI